MKFTVLMSVYKGDHPSYLEQAIQSLVDQILVPNEILIIKDGPLTDELNNILNKYQNNKIFTIINLGTNCGLGLALRKGVEMAKFDYIARMDSDDISLPDRFLNQVNYANSHPDVDLFGGFIKEFSNTNSKVFLRKVPLDIDSIYKRISFRSPFNHVSVFFKKESVLRAGNYQDFYTIEDCHLWARMIHFKMNLRNMPVVLVDVRFNSNTIQRRKNLRYLKAEIEQHFYYYKLGISSWYITLINIVIRLALRLLPSRLLLFIYRLTRD
jgi:glycosyltransferase involved in cell wall biosynthesis